MSGQDINSRIREKENKLKALRNEVSGYQQKIHEIEKIYQRLSNDKKTAKTYRDEIKDLRKHDFSKFDGDLHKQYKEKMSELRDAYDKVIDNIDTNMDRLNREKARYENKIYNLAGPIGNLVSGINSLKHEAENMFN